MARTELPVKNLAPNAGTPVAAETVVPGDGFYIDVNARTGVMDVKLPELLLIAVTPVAEVTATIGAGDYPPALAAGQGAIEVVCPAGDTTLLGPFESGRVQLNSGYVHLDLSGGADVAAFRFPRNT